MHKRLEAKAWKRCSRTKLYGLGTNHVLINSKRSAFEQHNLYRPRSLIALASFQSIKKVCGGARDPVAVGLHRQHTV